LGTWAVIATRTPMTYLHASLKPGGRLEQPVPADHKPFAYVFAGEDQFGPDARKGADGDMVQFAQDGDGVVIANDASAEDPLELLLLTGVPLGEPVARHGSFVMNTREEIVQAVEDYQAGRMGKITA
jgi:redox-sensitive bicupin YhaK (pirin superfamily)